MKVSVKITKTFKVAVKPLMKKYPSLLKDLETLDAELINNPKLGTPLGMNAYKIRLQIKSKGKGKSGGARVISLLQSELIGIINIVEENITVSLVTIYDKGDIAAINDKELKALISSANLD